MALSSPLHMDSSLDFAPEVALEDLGLPNEDWTWRWRGCLDHRDLRGTRCARKPVETLAGDMALLGLFSSLLAAGTQKASLVGPSLLYFLAY